MKIPEELRQKLRWANSLIDHYVASVVKPGSLVRWCGGGHDGRLAEVIKTWWDEIDWEITVSVRSRHKNGKGWTRVHRKRYPLSCFGPVKIEEVQNVQRPS